jgi:hypothetical protein
LRRLSEKQAAMVAMGSMLSAVGLNQSDDVAGIKQQLQEILTALSPLKAEVADLKLTIEKRFAVSDYNEGLRAVQPVIARNKVALTAAAGHGNP